MFKIGRPTRGCAQNTGQMPAVTFISSIPQFISVEEHAEQTSQTPASFSDILPVLRHREDNVRIEFDPPLDGFSEQDAANGTLYVIEKYIARSYFVSFSIY